MKISTWIGQQRTPSDMTPYHHLPGYLHRWTLCRCRRLVVRLHHILTPDATPYLHTHPFHYMSVIVSGGYAEQVLVGDELVVKNHTRGSVIFHRNKTPHRIVRVLPNTKTLFVAWTTAGSDQGWTLLPHRDVIEPDGYVRHPDGVYRHGSRYRKRHAGMWYALCNTIRAAQECTRLSIHQNIPSSELNALDTTK